MRKETIQFIGGIIAGFLLIPFALLLMAFCYHYLILPVHSLLLGLGITYSPYVLLAYISYRKKRPAFGWGLSLSGFFAVAFASEWLRWLLTLP